jgi:hypothetical protein
MNIWELINIIEDQGGPNKKLLSIMENSTTYGECFNVKLDKDGLPLKKYHFGDEWFEGDGPDYMGSLSYALKELYNLNVNDDLVILEESENGVTGPAEYYDENGL